MSRRWAIAASGWPSTTTCPASPARRRRWRSPMSRPARSTIRIGAGGIMLPNHAPLMIAEQFGTLAALHPGRIDLGLGRAPGSDQITARALRRDAARRRRRLPAGRGRADGLFPAGRAGPAGAGGAWRGARRADLDPRLQHSIGAQLAAILGLPYAFASHFAPAMMMEAMAIYRAAVPAVGAARGSRM